MIEIKRVQYKDNDSLLSLLKRCPRGTSLVVCQERHEDFFRRSAHYPHANAWAAWDGATIVGVLECAINQRMIGNQMKTTAYLYGMSVDPEYRRMGVAANLLTHVEREAVAAGVQIFYCSVMEDNYPSIGVLGKSGYVKRERFNHYTVMPMRKRKVPTGVRTLRRKDLPEVVDLINKHYDGYDFFHPFTENTLWEHWEQLPEFATDDIYIHECNGRIKSILGCWHASKVLASSIVQWDRRMNRLVRIAQAVSTVLPLPAVPNAGEILHNCTPYPLVYADSPKDLTPLWSILHNFALDHGHARISFMVPAEQKINMFQNIGFSIRSSSSMLMAKDMDGETFDLAKPVYLPPME